MESPTYECTNFADISKCFQQLHASLYQAISDVNTDLKLVKEKFSVLEATVEHLTEENRDFHEKYVPSIEDKFQEAGNDLLTLELWGRKWNLVVRGVEGDLKEQPKETDAVFRYFLEKVLKIDSSNVSAMSLQAIHRLPNGQEGKRNIIVRFTSLMERDFVLNQAIKTLKPKSGFAVVPDLPPTLAKLRSELLKKRDDLPEEEKKHLKLIYMKKPPFLKLDVNSMWLITMYRRIVSKGHPPYGFMKVALEFEDTVAESREISASKFKYAMTSAMRSLYGELGSTEKIDILKFDESRLEAIVRIPHRYFITLWTSLTICGSCYEEKCAFRILQVSAHLMGLAADSREFNFEVEEESTDN